MKMATKLNWFQRRLRPLRKYVARKRMIALMGWCRAWNRANRRDVSVKLLAG